MMPFRVHRYSAEITQTRGCRDQICSTTSGESKARARQAEREVEAGADTTGGGKGMPQEKPREVGKLVSTAYLPMLLYDRVVRMSV